MNSNGLPWEWPWQPRPIANTIRSDSSPARPILLSLSDLTDLTCSASTRSPTTMTQQYYKITSFLTAMTAAPSLSAWPLSFGPLDNGRSWQCKDFWIQGCTAFPPYNIRGAASPLRRPALTKTGVDDAWRCWPPSATIRLQQWPQPTSKWRRLRPTPTMDDFDSPSSPRPWPHDDFMPYANSTIFLQMGEDVMNRQWCCLWQPRWRFCLTQPFSSFAQLTHRSTGMDRGCRIAHTNFNNGRCLL